MRRTRLRWMYLPRTPKKKEKDHPLQIQNAQEFLYTTAVVATFTCVVAAIMALRKVQQRNRQAKQELMRKRCGQKVVVIGAGAGGCATAALIASASPDVHITVIEKDRQQIFQGQVPLAHVGHRSYDLGTTTGLDSLRSPATWNVTRDANLVMAEVLRVDPEARQVYVRSSPGMLASAKSLDEETPATNAVNSLVRWWRGGPKTPATISINEDGSPNLSDGTTVFSYDALVVAAGAQRTLGHLRNELPLHQIDSYRIAVNPGTTRDSLATVFAGNIVHIKMPPASFVWQMEAARALVGKGSGKQREGCVTLELGAPSTTATAATSVTTGPTSSATDSVSFEAFASSEDPTVLSTLWKAVRDRWEKRGAASTMRSSNDGDSEAAVLDEVALRLASEAEKKATSSSLCASSSRSWPLFFLSQWCMHFSSRQHDSTFVSSTNTIWKYLWYYNKLSLCQLFAVTADLQPIGPAPRQVNEVIERFWRERQLGCRHGHDREGDRFHVLYHSYATSLDSQTNTVTLYDYKNNAEVRLPFHLVVLDLALRAPGFVRQSGLHRTRYVEECVLPALTEGARTVADAWAKDTSPEKANAGATVQALRKNPLLGKTKAELESIFADETSFMDVDPTTLQHRRFSDVFAVGDVAGVPSAKSYGAVFAQVPVVVHNVRQVLKAQQMAAKGAADTAVEQRGTTSELTTASTPPLPRPNARYTGYSSYHVIMTTWRAMWPEMRYPVDPYGNAKPLPSLTSSAASPQAEEAVLQMKEKWDVVSPLTYCDHHMWSNLAWRDPRGFLNGLFYQSALYEVMYFFIFSRGQWHPPTWFSVPTFSSEDGTPCVPSLVDFL
ncbi:putative mitochondrial hypothetical protein [Leptomonas pyrrhocoris]|uniref:FAD/NAD(P)-binding domain-containing protein n=1 Tax=Leptomonas pyrrhocoris TaxID=157538 RepID=A0A0N0DWP3_LEPPY|nr:putative mitochondrial hypothetical protein [Leptomonas pyrrhocoris]KPA82012.1 putative mitochondrial hypothetical protein [Leptomonas pyrrhocoris]|eukprot:XP_015660451.1 putative mitochondrial hypothetical protein [Leptomonas pyrrhocoris]